MNWISVSDRLPRNGQIVLVWNNAYYWECAEHWTEDGRWVRCSDYRTIKAPTHWAEVPGPPKGVKP